MTAGSWFGQNVAWTESIALGECGSPQNGESKPFVADLKKKCNLSHRESEKMRIRLTLFWYNFNEPKKWMRKTNGIVHYRWLHNGAIAIAIVE